jgi:hypothetical protein
MKDEFLTCIAIRYSVIYHGGRYWRLGRRNDPDTYRRKLFDPERLALRRFLFEHLTLPSLDYQNLNPQVDRVQVLTATSLPDPEKAFLEALAAERDWMEIVYADEDAEEDPSQTALTDFIRRTGLASGRCISVRLDDDDAIAPGFRNALCELARDHTGDVAISLAKGVLLPFDEHRRVFGDLYEYNWPFGSVGLAHASRFDLSGPSATLPRAILDFGNHRKVAEQVPVLVDLRNISFIRTVYPSQDMAASDIKKIKPENALSASDAKALFPIPRLIASMGEIRYEGLFA